MSDPVAVTGRRLHPAPLRLMHWLNALSILLLIASGWTIYNDQPIIGALRFPAALTLAGEPDITYKLHGDVGFGNATQWHFAAMWLLVVNGFFYLLYGVVTGRFRRMLFPIRIPDVIKTVGQALRFRLPHDDLTMYNAVQKVLYVGVILLILLQVLIGLALWKPVQLSGLVALAGGFQAIRTLHFLGMLGLCAFLLIHVALAVLVPRTILAMLTGGPRVGRAVHPHTPGATS